MTALGNAVHIDNEANIVDIVRHHFIQAVYHRIVELLSVHKNGVTGFDEVDGIAYSECVSIIDGLEGLYVINA
jgi:hypothetical protein